jgi:hypothetical protein
MLKNTFSKFNVPAPFKLVFVTLFCLAVLCGCGVNEVSQRPPDAPLRGGTPPVINYPTSEDVEAGEGHFFRLSGGGGLVNFPSEYYATTYTGQPVLILSSKEQVNELFSEAYSQSFSEATGGWIKDNRFTNLINSYDEDFFESTEIVTFTLAAAGSGYYFELSKITFEDGVLTVEVDHKFSVPGTGAIVYWFGIVEIGRIPTDFHVEIQVNSRGW